MRNSAGVRAALLGGLALLAAAIALAVHHHHHTSSLPQPVGSWYSALAAPYAASGSRKKDACGVVVGPHTLGVAHPVLPCGAKIYVSYQGRQVLTQVIDRGRGASGALFDVTRPLAKLLGLDGTQTIRWRFAS